MNYKGTTSDPYIVTASDCYQEDLDHAILAVGWGVKDNINYLIVKNSWGTRWGVSGYILLEFTESGQGACGVLLDSTIPITN
jgi:C1A family cysteine protease